MKRQRVYKGTTSSFLFVITKINQSPDIFVVFIPKGKNRNFHCTLKLLAQIFYQLSTVSSVSHMRPAALSRKCSIRVVPLTHSGVL